MLIEKFMRNLSALPGLGSRSARRIAIHLLTQKDDKMLPLIKLMQEVSENIKNCDVCGNLDSQNPCNLCTNHNRDKDVICVVANVSDLWAMERTKTYRGQYHVLGGLLSALDGIGPDKLSIQSLLDRIAQDEYAEVILALNATVDGQSTVYYLTDQLEKFYKGKVTKLAHGMPMGGELDYLDEGTIITALKSRGTL